MISLTKYREQLEKEPQLTIAETYIFEGQFRMTVAWHLLAYLIVLAIALIPKWQHAMTFKENVVNTTPALPFVLLILLGSKSLGRLRRSSPKERERVERQIGALVEKLSKIPPPTG